MASFWTKPSPPMSRILMLRPLLAAVIVSLSLPAAAGAQTARSEVVTLTLDEAVQIARVSNNVLQTLRLDKKNADAQVLEGWAELFPQISLSSSYTRNIRSINPFSGSSAGSFFQGLGFIEWLAFNERARTDGIAGTNPISVEEFFLRQQAGQQAAGIAQSSGDNPFAVPTQYSNSLTITQKLFDGRAILGATGASKWLGPMNQAAVNRQEQVLIDQVQTAFYGSLLATEQARVMEQSVRRSQTTTTEVARQVAEGVAPKFQRLSAEVNLANLETQLAQTRNQTDASLDNLKLLLGISADQQIRLRGALEAEQAASGLLVARDDAMNEALLRRPDLEQSRIAIELEGIQLKVARSEYLPNIDAFLNVGYTGNIPTSRTIAVSDPNDPFSYSTQDLGYFSDAYWDTSVNVGFRFSWTIFNGLGSHRRIQQRKISVDKAKVNHEFLKASVAVQVDQSLRNLRTARQQMSSQGKNVERAELNYTFAEARLREGVASPLEVRDASDQLDQSRLNHLQAIHDFLVAQSAFKTAVGAPSEWSDPSFTSNQ
jgi:outer membrane protein TolC